MADVERRELERLANAGDLDAGRKLKREVMRDQECMACCGRMGATLVRGEGSGGEFWVCDEHADLFVANDPELFTRVAP